MLEWLLTFILEILFIFTLPIIFHFSNYYLIHEFCEIFCNLVDIVGLFYICFQFIIILILCRNYLFVIHFLKLVKFGLVHFNFQALLFIFKTTLIGIINIFSFIIWLFKNIIKKNK